MQILVGNKTRMACVVAASLSIAPAFAQSELPPGAGREQVQKVCGGCHSVSVITEYRATKEKWGEIVDNMVSRGAEGTDEEIDQVVNYLAEHFGAAAPRSKINVNKATAPEMVKALGISVEDASAIVEYRAKHGDYKDLEQLESVPEIDRKRIDARKDSIAF